MRLPRTLAAALVMAVPAACSDEAEEPLEVIIRENTRVMDADARDRLQAYDPATGTLVFAGTTEMLAALQPGDVLASEPTAAAPYGLLRKVTLVTPQGSGLAVDTVQASLREVIVQGELRADLALEPADLRSTKVLNPAAQALTAQPLTVSGLGFDIPVSGVLHDADGNPSTTADQVRVSGSLGFALGLTLDLGFRFEYDPPFDVDLTTKVVGILRMQERTSIDVTVAGAVSFDESVALASYEFGPYTFFVGPVPVVIVPVVTVAISGDGQASAALGFGANQSLTIEAGVRKDYGSGFRPVFSVTPSGSAHAPDLVASRSGPSFQVRGGLTARGAMRLYGLAGPYAELGAYALMTGGIGRAPPWRLWGGVRGGLGVEVDLAFWDYRYGTEVNPDMWFIAEATGNTAPELLDVLPASGTTIQVNQPVQLLSFAADVEDGYGCCPSTWVSSVEGTLSRPTGWYTFTTPGTRDLTVTARDSAGAASASKTVRISVVNSPPVVTLASPTAATTWYRGVPLMIYGWGTDGNEPCSSLTLEWTSGLAADVLPAASCDAPVLVTFATNGTRTLSLRATDSFGARATKSVSVTIVDPPGDIPPQVLILKPTPGAGMHNGSNRVEARIYDPDTPTLNYAWGVTNAQTGTSQAASGVVTGADVPLDVPITPNVLDEIVGSASPEPGKLLCSVNTPNTVALFAFTDFTAPGGEARVDVTCTYQVR